MAERLSPLVPLENGTFRNIWVANLASSFGALIQGVGAAWLMTSIADSVDMVALVQASTSLPIMMFSLLGGAIADSFNRRRVMLIAQCFMLAVSILLMAGAFLGLISPWLLLAFTFLLGCGTALNNPSWQASVGDLVPRTQLPAAVTLNSIGFNISRSVGPAIGGIIVAVAGAAGAFALNALSYLGLLYVLFRWQPPVEAKRLPREGIGPAMLSGIRYVAMSPNLLRILLRGSIFGFTAISVMALLPVVSASQLTGGPLTYGLMLGSFGLGAVGGALLSSRLHVRFSSEAVVRIAFVSFAIAAFITGVSTSAWITSPALMLGGASWVLALSLFNVSVQLSSPRWVVGRALSLYQTATFGGMALGSWIWGLAAESYGLAIAFGAASILMLAGALLGLRIPLPPRTMLDLDPLDRWQEPHLELELQPRSGPILIQISYKIRPENLTAFMAAMDARRRIRRRDGARHWTLLRDLGQPNLWTESYQTPTWTEYVRHNLRMTKADAEIGEQVRALHEGPEPPVVQRFVERPTNWFEVTGTPKSTIDHI